MADSPSDVSFEVQSAYLEGRADVVAQVLAVCERAREKRPAWHAMVRELQEACKPMQYHATRWDQA